MIYRPLNLSYMNYLNNLFFILLISSLFLGNVENIYGQTHEIDLTGAGGWVDLNSTARTVCPNTPYDIRIKATVGTTSHFKAGTLNTIDFQTTGTGGSTFGKGPVCMFNNPGSANIDHTIVTVKFLVAGPQSIKIFDYTPNGGSGCELATIISPAPGAELDNEATYNFDVTIEEQPHLADNIDVCAGETLTLIPTCSTGTCSNWTNYQWSMINGTTTAGSSASTYVVPTGEVPIGGTEDYVVRVEYGSCFDRDTITVRRRELPNLTALTFGTSTVPNPNTATTTARAELCIDGTQVLDIVCAGAGCPTTTQGDYEWFVRKSDLTGLTAGTDIISVGTSIATSTTAGTFTTGTMQSYSIKPGTHDVFVLATNEWGCENVFEKENALIINDLPGVEIYHNNGDPSWTDQTSADGSILCTGEKLGLSAHNCDHDDYVATNFPNNQTSTVDAMGYLDPNDGSKGAAGNYTSPCNGAFFATTTWRAWTGTSAAGTQLEITPVSGLEYTAATGTANSVPLTHNGTNDRIEIGTMVEGVITYQLEATGVNGCTNTDEVVVTVDKPEISFLADGTTYSYTTISTGNTNINGCTNTSLEITALCDICESGFNVTWTNPNGGQTNPLSGSANANPVTSNNPIISGTSSRTRYYVEAVDSRGCTTSSTSIGDKDFFLNPVEGPSLTSIAYNGDLCSGDDLSFILTGAAGCPLVSYSYTVFDGDPASGGNQVYACTGDPSPPACANGIQAAAGYCNVTNVNMAAKTAILTLSDLVGPSNETAYQPVDGTTYYVVASTGGSCNIPAVSAPSANVGQTPNAQIGVSYRGTYSSTFCNNRQVALYIDMNGANHNSFDYVWSVVGQLPVAGIGVPDLSPQPALNPTSGLIPFSNGNGGGGFFGFFSNPPRGATISSSHLAGVHYTDVDIEVEITATGSTCSQVLEYSDIDIINCEEPTLTASVIETNGNAPISGFSTQEIGAPNKEFNVLCEGHTMILNPDIGYTGSSFTTYSATYSGNSTSYKSSEASFIWNSGESTQSISIAATAASPDTILRSVYIIDLNGDTTAYLEHEFVISRGNVNFFPQGDNAANADTSICENDLLLAQANCPSCFGDLSYEWDGTGPVIVSSGEIHQTYQDGPLVTTPTDSFSTVLILRHGETGVCNVSVARQTTINELPTVGITYNGTPVVGGGGASYLCDGEVGILNANCGTCVSSTVNWNTNATTPSINVLSQGGYYALIEDQDGCESVTQVVVIIDALDGLNSSVVANPSEICDGNLVNLEVIPCVGCSYQWVDQTQGTVIAPGRIYPASDTGIYYALVTNAENCVYPTTQLTINATTPAIPNIFGSTDSVCSNQIAVLWTNSGSGFQYQWYKNDGAGFYLISGATDSSYTTIPGEVGEYRVAVTYPNGCSNESGIFTIDPATFVPNIYNNGINEICKGATVELSTDLYANWQYQWYRDGILIQDTSATGSIYYADSAGSYYVEVINYNLCVVQSTTIDLTKTTLLKPRATTTTPTICPGELGKLSVSLCSGCEYEWLDITPTTIASKSVSRFNYDSVQVTGDYYAIVSKGVCSEISDTVNITVNPVFTPAISSSSSVVCNGRDANLVTQGCVGCSYQWLINGSPVLGSLNDTFHLVDNVSEIGDYQIAVDYPNGCSDTSATLNIENGSDTVFLTVPSLDSVICNTVGEVLLATPQSSLTGTYFYTLFLDNTPVTGYSNVTSNTFPGNSAGVYTVEMINPLGCKAISNLLPLRTVDIIPTLGSWATSNPNSVPAIAICTDSGSVYLQVAVSPTCSSCTYEWKDGGNVIIPSSTITYYTADTSGLYIVEVTDDGCTASSNLVSIAYSTGTLDSEANTTDTSICNGQSVTLEHADRLNCVGCSYRWLRGVTSTSPNPINGASNYQYITGTPGFYNLEITTSDGCIDTSSVINIRQVDPPSGLTLNFDTLVTIGLNSATGTPLASNGSFIDMNNWVFPSYARHDSLDLTFTSYFTSTPFNGALSANAGLQGRDSILFQPEDSLAGYHLITYYYDTLGCTFTTSDVLEVNPPAAISVTNLNPVSVAYEACVGDVLVINTTNLNFAIDEIFAFDENDDYQLIQPANINSISSSPDTFGVNIRWNTTINLTVPGNAYASYLMLVGTNLVTGLRDTTYTSFVLIHNTDLSFTGLPNMLCSNGEGTPLFGSPTGGSFYAETTAGSLIPGTFVGDTLYPQQFTQAAYVDGSQYVDIYYSYTESYTNGQSCPDDDTVSIRKEVKDVRLTNVQFNTISVSQSQELLTNLVSQTTPYAARPNKQPLYTSSFSGSFTNPAGNPTDFLPADAGVGRHALTYRIQSGDCINSVEDSVTVVPAPTPIPMPDTICRNYGTTPFAREIAVFPYGAPTVSYPPNTAVASYTDEINIINVTGQGVVAGNTNLGSETYTYDPTLVAGNYDTLIIEYGFYRDEDTLDVMGVPVDFDTLEYVVAQIIKPIYIEDLTPVNIIDTIVSSFYCQENTLHLLAGNPSNNAFGGGLFMLYGGTNQYQFGDTLHNSVINPYDVNNLENATTTYDLVYVLNGAACNNSDTMSVTIGRGLNPAFATVNGLDEFCDTDPDVLITHNVVAPDTAILTIGGVPQPSYLFGPDPLDPGIHVVELQQLYTYIQATDTFVCSASAIDTFTIHALPTVTMTPSLDDQYCANDTVVNLVVGPTPSCPLYAAPGHIILDEKFDVGGIPPSWNSTFNISGKNWIATPLLPEGGTGNAAFIDTSQFLNDSWLITRALDLVAGHTYRLTYMVRAGELDPTCSGLCDAQLSVGLGTSVTAPMPFSLVPLVIIDNDQTYVRYTVDHYHDPLAGFTTGQYFIGFRSVTPALGRSLRLDNVRMRNMTLDNCSLEGIGYMDGPGVHNVKDSLYQFNPLAVTAGNVEVKYIYTDVKGCQDSLVFPITVDTAPIVSFTDLPLTYCENEPTLLLTGSPLGGEFTSTLGTNLVPVGLAVLDTADFPVNYQTNTAGMDIVSYRFEDNNGCFEMVHDTIDIVPLLDSVFIPSSLLDPFGNGHCVNADSTILDVSLFSGTLITNGVFYGSGVRNGAGGAGAAIFYPDSAEIDMGHVGDVAIDYIYTTTTGCADTTQFTTRVHALPDLSFMNLPDSLCLNADSFQVVAINHVVTGSMGQIMYADTLINNAGQFIATDTNGVQLPNFIQLFDTLYPYTADAYSQVNVTYNYTASAAFGLCSSTIYDSVRIDSIPEVYFQNLSPYYCENEPASIFLAFPAFSVGSGYLLIDSIQVDSSFYWIDPAVMVGPGLTTAVYPTYYTFTDTRGCRGEAYDTFEVRPYPRITFDPAAQDTFCRQVGLYDLRQLLTAPIGGYFTDNLALTSVQDSFYLNLNSLAGPRLVTYHYTDPLTLCQNQDTIWLYLFNSPEIDFNIYGGCAQMDITFDGFANNLDAQVDSITRIWWDFEGNGIITNSPLDTSRITMPDITYQYAANGTYNVTLNVQNQGSCTASINKSLIVSPYYDLATDYFENFNNGAGDWYDDQPADVTPNNVWTHENSLTSNFISNPDGFWVTMAAEPYYEVSQSAWVYSPCFDFTASQRPMIALDLWRDVLPGIDGAVLEFYNNTSNDWELVGGLGDGINWYQSDFILGRPGNQLNSTFPSGWTGRSNGAESARLRLDRFKGQRDIRLRIAFATSSQTVIDSTSGSGYEGVAFDNVWIGERTRNVLVEHFDHVNYVNSNSLTSPVINGSVYNKIFNSLNGLDVILIQYQTEEQTLGTDPLFSTNPADLSSRQYQYSAQPNNIFVDGRTIGDGLSESLDQSDLDYDMLQFPDFDIQIATPVTIVNGVLTTSATVEALVAKDSSTTYTTRVAVIQDSFTYVNNSHMLSVFRKMLPNNGGIRKTDGWQLGEQQMITQSLTLSTLGQQVPVNETQLEVIVFLQDANDNIREVFQANTTQDLNRYTGTTQLEDDLATEIFDLNVYPNPSSDLFNVEFDKALAGEYNWRLVDVTGRVLQTGATSTGTKKFTIDAEALVDGAYFFIINSDDNRAYAQRKLIVIK